MKLLSKLWLELLTLTSAIFFISTNYSYVRKSYDCINPFIPGPYISGECDLVTMLDISLIYMAAIAIIHILGYFLFSNRSYIKLGIVSMLIGGIVLGNYFIFYNDALLITDQAQIILENPNE